MLPWCLQLLVLLLLPVLDCRSNVWLAVGPQQHALHQQRAPGS
jgi:hypothetical protein